MSGCVDVNELKRKKKKARKWGLAVVAGLWFLRNGVIQSETNVYSVALFTMDDKKKKKTGTLFEK